MATTRSAKSRLARLNRAPEEPPTPLRRVRPPSEANLWRDAASIRKRYNARAQALDEAAIERDRVIRDMLAAEIPRAHIAEFFDLSVPRIDQIRHGTR